MKRNFIGTIPKGTPLFQIVPIKRDEWTHKLDYSDKKFSTNKIEEEKRRSKIFSYYKSHAWRRKKYE